MQVRVFVCIDGVQLSFTVDSGVWSLWCLSWAAWPLSWTYLLAERFSGVLSNFFFPAFGSCLAFLHCPILVVECVTSWWFSMSCTPKRSLQRVTRNSWLALRDSKSSISVQIQAHPDLIRKDKIIRWAGAIIPRRPARFTTSNQLYCLAVSTQIVKLQTFFRSASQNETRIRSLTWKCENWLCQVDKSARRGPNDWRISETSSHAYGCPWLQR